MKKSSILIASLMPIILAACGTETKTEVPTDKKEASTETKSQKSEKPYKSIDSIKQLKRIDINEEVSKAHEGKVVEYFSFTCIHCKNVSPLVKDSNSNLTNKIEVVHLVSANSEISQSRYKLNETLEKFKKPELIEAAFTLTMDRELSTTQSILDFISKNDSNNEMITYFNSEELGSKLEIEISNQSKFTIPGTPYFLIDGTHTIDLNSLKTWKEGVVSISKASEMIKK